MVDLAAAFLAVATFMAVPVFIAFDVNVIDIDLSFETGAPRVRLGVEAPRLGIEAPAFAAALAAPPARIGIETTGGPSMLTIPNSDQCRTI